MVPPQGQSCCSLWLHTSRHIHWHANRAQACIFSAFWTLKFLAGWHTLLGKLEAGVAVILASGTQALRLNKNEGGRIVLGVQLGILIGVDVEVKEEMCSMSFLFLIKISYVLPVQ